MSTNYKIKMERVAAKVFHPKTRINRKTKINLVFDPVARKEFLSGFRKRKLQRQKTAQEELKQQLRDEKTKLRKDARETYRKLVASRQGVPEVEHLLAEEHDVDNHSVTITELSTTELAEKNNWIGSNKVQYEEVKKEEESDEDEELPGMELKTKRQIKRIVQKQATKTIQKSKAFQTKTKLEAQKNKKKSRKLKKQDDKVLKKSKKAKRARIQTRH